MNSKQQWLKGQSDCPMEFNSFFSFCIVWVTTPLQQSPEALTGPTIWMVPGRNGDHGSLTQPWCLLSKEHISCFAGQSSPWELHTCARLLHSGLPGDLLLAWRISSGQMFLSFCYIFISQVGGKSRCYHTCIYKVSSFSHYSERNTVLYWWLNSICRFSKYVYYICIFTYIWQWHIYIIW